MREKLEKNKKMANSSVKLVREALNTLRIDCLGSLLLHPPTSTLNAKVIQRTLEAMVQLTHTMAKQLFNPDFNILNDLKELFTEYQDRMDKINSMIYERTMQIAEIRKWVSTQFYTFDLA